ncbi:Type I restriction-modification system, specificity subunit S [Methanosarcina siciliae T4/M]|uniref:Type I restriction-modification system, specificity subunit S n=1 Tax=Methanosarcina siciliae T4/M TaxID=1434120 RepID=A0A0E3P592_9EURY|nr:restriction endonuclease subunit S [Methanosarcina siciliae]AKB28787.1 Type I restriction-modification system, specificity subunit S [Methanosarcina siciliae T4/M]
MNPETFFENFDLLCEAPNSVEKLRELILQLAVMGKLVPQDPNDEPASVLLDQMRNEKKMLIREKKLRKEESLPPIELKDIPFEISETWKWVHFRDIGHIVGGGTPATSNPDYFSEEGIPWLTPADLYNLKGKFVAKGKRDISELGLQKSSAQLVPAGTVLFSSRAPIGYVAIATEDLATNQGFKSCVPFIMEMNEFIYYFLKYAGKEIDRNASGTTFKEVSGKIMSQVLFPLPPLSEQKRIVSKVDELIALCDKLEARRQKKQEVQSKLNSAALDRMLSAENQEEFAQHWQRICENFDLLYDNPENVEKLRQAILQLAVQGRLVEQNLEDEPASVLIEKIGTKKRQMVKEGKIKKVSPLKQVSECEFPFDLPKNWIWIRLGDGLLKLTDGTHHSPTNESTGDFKYITAKNIKTDGIDLTNITYVTSKIHEEIYSRCDPEYGDILYIKDGATTGVTVINDLEEQFSMLSSVALMKLPSEIENKYLLYMLRSPYFYSLMREGMSGVAITRVTLTKLNNALVPLPPLNEQKRIVEIVEQFMGLCDELESKLRKEREDSEKLMETVVRGLLEGVVVEI